MAYSICWKHQTVTAWGCRECLREETRAAVKEVCESTKKLIDDAFRHPVKRKRRSKPASVARPLRER